MPTPLIVKATGETRLVEDADLSAAIASGQYVAPDGPQAVAVHRFGQDTYAAPEQVEQEGELLAPRIAASRAELELGQRARAEEQSGFGGTARAALGGGVSGLSFGALNPFEEAQEFHPLAAGAASLAAPFLVPGAELSFLKDAEGAERATGTLSSRALFGGEVGAARDVERAAERGLLGAPGKLERAAAGAVEETPQIAAKRKLAGDIASFRKDLADQKLFLAWKGGAADAEGNAIAGVSKIGKRTLKADRQLDALIDNPYAFAERPERALSALQQHQAALEELLTKEPELRGAFAADETAARTGALDRVPEALERNKALQSRIREVTAKVASTEAGEGGLVGEMLGAHVFGKVEKLAENIPLVGPVLGAKAAELVKSLVFGKMGEAVGHGVGSTADALKALFGTATAAPAVAMTATQVLGGTRFAPAVDDAPKDGDRKETLAEVFHKRANEIRSQTAYDATGAPRMRPEARQAMAARLDPIRRTSPIAADRMETTAARRIEYLSSKIPRRPDLPVVPGAADKWQPSDMQMRQFARRVAAVEHPAGVEQRLAHGTITPEDAEAYRAVYPERYAAVQAQIAAKIPELRAALPYAKRVSLSIFSGSAVDPAMHPVVLRVLQGQFSEPGTEGGTQAPRPQPQFGSVRKSVESPTAGQSREAGVRG